MVTGNAAAVYTADIHTIYCSGNPKGRSLTFCPPQTGGSERGLVRKDKVNAKGFGFPGFYSGSASGTLLFLIRRDFLKDKLFFTPLFKTIEAFIYHENNI